MGAPDGFERKEIIYRIGTFFIILGIGLLVFFVISEATQQPTVSYFCWSLILLIVGFIFRAQLRRGVKPSERFSLVRRLMPKAKREEKRSSPADQGKKL